MIEPMERNATVPKARAVCDDCGRDEVVTCDYERQRGGDWKVNEGQALRKLHGWAMVKGKLRCPSCETKRKIFTAKKPEEPMADNITELRRPSREQKRQIVLLLTDAYDTEAGRYTGADTDKTLADAIGGGCMPGWVAEIREEIFGPDGGNEEIEALAEEVRAWRTAMEKQAGELRDRHVQFSADLRKFNETRDKAGEYLKRIEALKAAVGPKARAV